MSDVWRFPHPLAEAAPPSAPPEAAQNVGHGRVFARPDGHKDRCGGPGLCRRCTEDQTHRDALVASLQQPVWAAPLHAWLTAETDVLDFDGAEIPPRLRAILEQVLRADGVL